MMYFHCTLCIKEKPLCCCLSFFWYTLILLCLHRDVFYWDIIKQEMRFWYKAIAFVQSKAANFPKLWEILNSRSSVTGFELCWRRLEKSLHSNWKRELWEIWREEREENRSGREHTIYVKSFHRKDRERSKWKTKACKIFTSVNVSELPSGGINGRVAGWWSRFQNNEYNC